MVCIWLFDWILVCRKWWVLVLVWCCWCVGLVCREWSYWILLNVLCLDVCRWVLLWLFVVLLVCRWLFGCFCWFWGFVGCWLGVLFCCVVVGSCSGFGCWLLVSCRLVWFVCCVFFWFVGWGLGRCCLDGYWWISDGCCWVGFWGCLWVFGIRLGNGFVWFRMWLVWWLSGCVVVGMLCFSFLIVFIRDEVVSEFWSMGGCWVFVINFWL